MKTIRNLGGDTEQNILLLFSLNLLSVCLNAQVATGNWKKTKTRSPVSPVRLELKLMDQHVFSTWGITGTDFPTQLEEKSSASLTLRCPSSGRSDPRSVSFVYGRSVDKVTHYLLVVSETGSDQAPLCCSFKVRGEDEESKQERDC